MVLRYLIDPCAMGAVIAVEHDLNAIGNADDIVKRGPGDRTGCTIPAQDLLNL